MSGGDRLLHTASVGDRHYPASVPLILLCQHVVKGEFIWTLVLIDTIMLPRLQHRKQFSISTEIRC